MTLAELKAKAASLGLTPDDVRQHGSLTKKATWESAITEKEQDIPQSYPEDEPEMVNIVTVQAIAPESSEIAPGDDFVQNHLRPSEPIPTIEPEVEMNGWHRWDEKLQVWIKEDPEETLKDCYQPESESYRQQLLKRMKPYVGVCVQSKDFEQLKNEPLDESTAAIYLGLLEESERMLKDAVTA